MASESSSSSESGIPLEEIPSKEVIHHEGIEKDSNEHGIEHSVAKKNVETFKPIT